MKLKEPMSFSSSFIFFFFFLSLFFFLSFCSSEPLATQCTHSTSPHAWTFACPQAMKWWKLDGVSAQNIYQFSGHNFGIQGRISSWKIEANREGKGAGQPRGVEPAGLLPVGLHFFGFFCFPSLCFIEICSWFHCFAVEIIIHTQYIGCGQGGVINSKF